MNRKLPPNLCPRRYQTRGGYPGFYEAAEEWARERSTPIGRGKGE